jgi:predicted membrane protein
MIGVSIVLLGVSALTGISFFNFFFAAVLILIGIRIITGRKYCGYGAYAEDQGPASPEDEVSEVAIFSALKKEVASEDFKGGKVVLVFAGGEIDLSKAKVSGKSVDFEIAAVFGGAKLIVPKEWTVNASKIAAVLGGVSNTTQKGSGDVTLHLKGAAVFGGIEIGN